MTRLFSQYFPLSTLIVIALDALLVFFAILFSYYLLYPGGNTAFLHSVPGAVTIALAMVAMTGTLGLQGGKAEELWPFISRVTLAFLVVLPALHWMFYNLPDGSIAVPCLEATILFGLVGKLAAYSFSRVSSSMIDRRVLVIGVGEDAASVKETLEQSRIPGLAIVGFYSLFEDQKADPSIPAAKILAAARSIGETTSRHNVNEIIIALRERRGGTLPLRDLLNCKLRGIKVTDLSTFFEQYSSKVRIDLLRESWFIFGDGFRQGRMRMLVKRSFDVLASAVLLTLGFPMMVLAALAIKLESDGPVIFRQERVGFGGRSFNMLKFRSMRVDAERDGRPQWAQAGDSRVTRVGRIMRRTRIDELPQLINVLAGHMSLVGPRPERPFFVQELAKQIPYYETRHSVKPGVTGWAQVRHHYTASIEDTTGKLEYDLFYVKNHTLVFDLFVLWCSVRVVLTGHGAR